MIGINMARILPYTVYLNEKFAVDSDIKKMPQWQWCQNIFGPDYVQNEMMWYWHGKIEWHGITFAFHKESDATMFRLRWCN